MSSPLALLLFTAAPDAAAAPPPLPQARAVGIARARIVAPVRVRLSGDGALSTGTADSGPRMLTHQQARRDGARVIDCY